MRGRRKLSVSSLSSSMVAVLSLRWFVRVGERTVAGRVGSSWCPAALRCCRTRLPYRFVHLCRPVREHARLLPPPATQQQRRAANSQVSTPRHSAFRRAEGSLRSPAAGAYIVVSCVPAAVGVCGCQQVESEEWLRRATSEGQAVRAHSHRVDSLVVSPVVRSCVTHSRLPSNR